jgi:lipoprotein-anchoring transpeptidase ErfK/SrfK
LSRKVALLLTLLLGVGLGASPAAARDYRYYYNYNYYYVGQRPEPRAALKAAPKPGLKPAAQPDQGPFGNIPKGPVQIVISLNQQQLHLYSDGVPIADSPIASGVPQLPTPLGVFSIIQKQRYHESNIYSNAPMPFMERITWSGVALHEGENIGHPASHGCVRLPHDFAERLFYLTKVGAPVIIARPELKLSDFADPHLFVHKDAPPPAPATPVAAAPEQTAQAAPPASTDSAKPADKTADATADKTVEKTDDRTTDTVPPTPIPVAAPVAANVDQLGLRASDASAAPKPKLDPAKTAPVNKEPIAIFISRKENKIYVRQDFAPLFSFPITVADPDKPLGTHVFTALDYAGDDHTALRWNVLSLPGEPPPARKAEKDKHDVKSAEKNAAGKRGGQDKEQDKGTGVLPPPQTAAEALARIDIPQAAIDAISQRIVPGSSLIVSDHGLGDETGDGTNFIVVTQ